MNGFTVNTVRLKSYTSDIDSIIKELDRIQTVVASASKLNMDFSSATLASLKNQMKKYGGKIREYKYCSGELKTKLDEIVRLYEKTEFGLSGVNQSDITLVANGESTSNLLLLLKQLGIEYPFITVIGALFGGIPGIAIGSVIDNLYINKGKVEKFVDGIKDKDTVDNMPLKYKSILANKYSEVSSDYIFAKDIFDKHKENMVIANFGTTKKNEKTNKEVEIAYFLNGIIYLNTNLDVNSARGDGAVFYHEYGHYIVESEGWVTADGQVDPEFQKFNDTIVREIEAYIKQMENKILDSVQGSIYMDDLKKRALDLMKDDLGINAGNYHVYDGLSDAIDGVSELKYRRDTYNISYGHDDGYFIEREDRAIIGNEAFANIFAAMMTGDEKEISKMREIMPESIAMFQALIESKL